MIRVLAFLVAFLASGPVYAQCVGAMQRNSNLSDTCNAATARSNLGANSATNLTTGTLPAARLPAPAASAFGGVQSLAATANNFFTGLGTDGIFTRSALVMADLPAAARTVTITFIIDGGGSAITTGVKGDIEIPFACTITAVRTLLDQSGSIVVDIWKDIYANFPPTDADSITASAPPTVSSATKSEDTTLTGWPTSIAAGSILRYNVDSITTATRATVSLTCVKS